MSDRTAQEHADTLRGALAQLRGILRVHVLPADDALDGLCADLAAAREALELLARSDGWGDYFRCGCMDEVNRIASAALARLSAGKKTGDE